MLSRYSLIYTYKKQENTISSWPNGDDSDDNVILILRLIILMDEAIDG